MSESKDHAPAVVPLAQAGLRKEGVDEQLKTLLHSEALERKAAVKKLLGHLVRESFAGNVENLRSRKICEFLYPRHKAAASQLRGDIGKLRKCLDAHYSSSEAMPGEIRFTIPEGQYVVDAPRASHPTAAPPAGRPGAAARIFEPAADAEVHQRVPVRGRIDSLNIDLRPWLVVRTPGGDLYPQCRVRRNGPEWEEEVRIGLLQWGADEGAIYEINLVAADADGDAAFYQYMKSGRDGFGPLLPTDCVVLDAKKVTRRDIRSEG